MQRHPNGTRVLQRRMDTKAFLPPHLSPYHIIHLIIRLSTNIFQLNESSVLDLTMSAWASRHLKSFSCTFHSDVRYTNGCGLRLHLSFLPECQTTVPIHTNTTRILQKDFESSQSTEAIVDSLSRSDQWVSSSI